MLVFMFLLYPSTSAALLSTFRCREVEGTVYLQADFGSECYNKDWWNALPWVCMFMLVYVIGIPAGIAFVLRGHRTKAAGAIIVNSRAQESLEQISYGFITEGKETG
jgi:hypothetical protein